MSKQIALVTGGSRGIGRAICLELAKSGAHVVVNFRSNKIAAEETLGLIHQAGGTGETVCFDVANQEETERNIESLLTRHEAIDLQTERPPVRWRVQCAAQPSHASGPRGVS